jgi:hypothetical protein
LIFKNELSNLNGVIKPLIKAISEPNY